MKKAPNIGFILATIAVLCGSCHKYPDDPFISTESVTTRICKKWQLKSYKINGIDSMSKFTYSVTNTATPNYTHVLEIDNEPAQGGQSAYIDFMLYDTNENGFVSFGNNNKEVNFYDQWGGVPAPPSTSPNYYSKGFLFPNFPTTFTIKELYGSALKLCRTDNNGNYYDLVFTEITITP